MRCWVRRGLIVGWLALLAGSTFARAHVWQSDRQLWANAARQAPLKPRPLLNYGRTLEQAGEWDQADDLYRRVIGLSFDARRGTYLNRYTRAAAETNLAHLYILRGWHASALRVLNNTLEDWPEFPYARYNRGALLWAYGACRDARADFTVAQRWDATLPDPTTPCPSIH